MQSVIQRVFWASVLLTASAFSWISLNWPVRLCHRSLDTLEKIPALCFRNDGTNSGLTGAGFKALQVQYCKEDYRYGRVRTGHQSCGFNTIHVGHRQVQQNQVWFQFVEFLNTRPSILGFPANSPVPRAYDGAENTPSHIGVINNQNS